MCHTTTLHFYAHPLSFPFFFSPVVLLGSVRGARKIAVDNLHVVRTMQAFICRNKDHCSILDELVVMHIHVLHVEQLGPACRSASGEVHQYQQLLLGLGHLTQVATDLARVELNRDDKGRATARSC